MKPKLNQNRNLHFEAIGTVWQIDISDVSDDQFSKVENSIKERIEVFDKHYSRFREDSFVSEMSKKPGVYRLPHDAKPMLDLYEKLYGVTNGAFTPLIGDTLVDAGYDASYSLVPKNVKSPFTWDEAIDYHFPFITIKKPTMLDFGGLGKGYLVDILANVLKSQSLHSFTIDAGGDMYTFGREITVGLEHPVHDDEVIGTIAINNASLCGSAGKRRAWDKYHHIINPHTLRSPKNILSSWVVAESTLLADAMATCLFLVDSVTLKMHFKFEFLTVFADFSIEKSDNFIAKIFTNETD